MTAPTCALCGKPWREKSPDCARHDSYESKAAHYEFDGKLTRAEAEKRAVRDVTTATRGES